MLNRVEVHTPLGAILSLPLEDISNGYLVRGIDGLDPVPANIVSSSFARLDGEQYQSSRREKRNIVLRVGLEPDYTDSTVQDLRRNLYSFLIPKSKVFLRFFIDNFPALEIVGYVESFEAPLFVQEPVATISILCMLPDFYEPVETVITGQTTTGTTMGEIDYTGGVDTGVVISVIVPNGAPEQSSLTIYNQPEGESVQQFLVNGPIQGNRTFEFSTSIGDKYARSIVANLPASILSRVSPTSVWTTLKPGRNFFRIQMGGPARNFTLRYTNKHGGL